MPYVRYRKYAGDPTRSTSRALRQCAGRELELKTALDGEWPDGLLVFCTVPLQASCASRSTLCATGGVAWLGARSSTALAISETYKPTNLRNCRGKRTPQGSDVAARRSRGRRPSSRSIRARSAG